MSGRKTRRLARRRGLSLLEVILSVAILGASLAVVVELVFSGARAARKADVEILAQIHCRTLLSEVRAGIRSAELVTEAPLGVPDTRHRWMYAIETEPTLMEGLLLVRVMVWDAASQTPTGQPVGYQLQTWIIDPAWEEELQQQSEESAAATGL